MKFFSNLAITNKILVCVAMMAMLTAGMTVFAVLQAGEMERNTATLIDDPVKGTNLAARFDGAFAHAHQLAYEMALESDDANLNKLDNAFNQQIAEAQSALTEMKPLIVGEHVAPYGVINTHLKTYLDLKAQVLAQRRARQIAQAEDTLQSRVAPVFDQIDEATTLLVHQQEADIADGGAHAKAVYNNITMWLIGSGLAGALLIGGLAILLSRREIVTPITRTIVTMQKLAAGDLTAEVAGHERRDEIGKIAAAVQVFKEAGLEKVRLEKEAESARARADEERTQNAAAQAEVVAKVAEGLENLSKGELTFRLNSPFAAEYEGLRADFNSAIGQLQDTMKVIGSSTGGIQTGTSEIGQAADDLSRRTEQQAATLEQTAAALDEITATVRKTAEGAVQANTVVADAKHDAERSGDVVREAVAAMSQIEKSAQEIGQIIGVIDEIAFQTNLLALNAGVEAARAGDAGKGFAVVASEVRALAQRSAEAAKEIKTLISTSSQQVSQGVNLVGQTGEALQSIVGKVSEITGLVSEISASAQEQATALAQVNTAVNQMDQVTQQNAAMVEQSTAASHSLTHEAGELARLVSRFQTGEPAMAMAAPPARTAGRPQAADFRNRYAAPALKTTSQIARAPQPQDEGWEEF